MYKLAEVRNVHLELTTRCNARCPQCPRTGPGGVTSPDTPEAELSLADVQTILPPEVVAQLSSLYLCGNYGDALVAKDTLAVLEYLRRHNRRMRLRLHTNGSARSPQWWVQLARLLDSCTFGIDGLEDTHHLYRRHTRWEIILRSARAFIGAGGKADWVYLVFRHNEHQIEAARELAKELGFQSFTVKKSERFTSAGRILERIPVRRGDGEIDYYLELPSALEHRNEGVIATDRLSRGGAYQEHLKESPIRCKAVLGRKIYVSAEGLVFPCCWLGKLYRQGQARGQGEPARLLARLPCGGSELDAMIHPLETLLEGDYFQRLVPEGWRRDSEAPGSRLVTCSRMCGGVEVHETQFG